MIRAVYQGMATETVAAVHLRARRLIAEGQQTVDGGRIAFRQIRAAVHRTGVIGGVALLAQPWGASLEQRHIVRAVRRMTVGAVLGHRAVFPQERAAAVRVTGVAGLVHAVL